MASADNVQPYQGYPAISSGGQTQEMTVITTQVQVRTEWDGINFLQPMRYVRMKKAKSCLGYELDVYDESGTKIGVSKQDCMNIALSNFYDCMKIETEIPDENPAMQNRRDFDIWRFLFRNLCYMFEDSTLTRIYDKSGNTIGSFDYSPRFCMMEPGCCKGVYVIKNNANERLFYIKQNQKDPCFGCGTRTGDCCKRIKDDCCRRPDPLSIAAEILDVRDDSTVSFVRRMEQPKGGCPPRCKKPTPQYRVDYEREHENDESKALIYGTALLMGRKNLIELDALGTSIADENADLLV